MGSHHSPAAAAAGLPTQPKTYLSSRPTMGLKLRMGLALSGLALSSMFGVNMLSGIKDYVDTTGNIMVDIADGIGMVSKGIEALEYYIDPSAEAQVEETAKKPEEPGAATDGSAPTVIAGQPVAPVSPDQPAVFCQKGKCYPYDPSKVKGVNLEAKPGMIIQAAPTTSPKKASPTAPPQRGPSTPQKGHKGQISPAQKGRSRDDDDDERGKSKSSSSPKADRSSVAGSVPSTPIPATPEPKVENSTAQTVSNSTSSSNNSTSITGTKKVLSATRNLLERLSKLLVKFVHRIFPWNRRARRRVMGDGDDDEL